jgi:hypothetical protein
MGAHDINIGFSFTHTVKATFTNMENLQLLEVAFQLSHEFIGYDIHREFTELSVEGT